MTNTIRANLKPGQLVEIVLKKDQKSGILTTGVIQRILSPGKEHHRGIKVMLEDGQVGRVQNILTVIYYYSDEKCQKILTPNEMEGFGRVKDPGLYPDAITCKVSKSRLGKFEHWIIVEDLQIKKWVITTHLNVKDGVVKSITDYTSDLIKNEGDNLDSLKHSLTINNGKDILIYPIHDIIPTRIIQLF